MLTVSNRLRGVTTKMKTIVLSSLCALITLCHIPSVLSEGQPKRASLPPRGWNSYDAFSWIISEEEFLQNAELVAQRLKARGYEYVVVDFLWYRRKVPGAYTDSLGFDVIDEWGRMIPDPGRWPSSKDGKGFAEVAKKVHSLGLKFGIHVMRGISTQAVNANTPILDTTKGSTYVESGRQWHAKDIGLKERACAWMSNGFMSVNTNLGAGRVFLRSLYQQYADWGVDFVKNDCVFGADLDLDEISFVSEVLKELNRPILYSLSPGTSVTPTMAKQVYGLANMYRITADDWDLWNDVASHFNITRDFSTANLIGAQGLLGKSWPDLDMLPLGWLTDPGANEGPHRSSRLSQEEKQTQMTLWSMAKSPLMFGGDMRNLDEATFNLITNPTLLEINHFSSNNAEFPYVTGRNDLQFRNRGLAWQSTSLADTDAPETQIFGLTSCMDPKAKFWSIKALDNDLEQVCWKGSMTGSDEAPFCLYKRKPFLSSGEEMTYKHQYQEKLHLLSTDGMELCLHGSPKTRLTSKEFKRGSFSPCKWDTNQMWELSYDGTLKNSYSGSCALVNTVKANAGFGGIRSWIATGRRGEIYVAFFNLNAEKTVISAKISDVAKALHSKHMKNVSCKCTELWSGKDFGEVEDSISMAVEMHGCALFTLICD